MGRHSARARWHFIRSVILWAAPWLIGAAVLVAVAWAASSWLTEDGARPASAGRTASSGEGRSPHHRPGGAGNEATPSAAQPSQATPASSPTPSARPTRAPLITRGVTVQVLDTTGGGQAEPWAQRLEAMGYEVISVQPGLGPYPETTVYWSRPSERPAAKALAARFGWSTAPRPGNLSPEVSIHVVLGEDEG